MPEASVTIIHPLSSAAHSCARQQWKRYCALPRARSVVSSQRPSRSVAGDLLRRAVGGPSRLEPHAEEESRAGTADEDQAPPLDEQASAAWGGGRPRARQLLADVATGYRLKVAAPDLLSCTAFVMEC